MKTRLALLLTVLTVLTLLNAPAYAGGCYDVSQGQPASLTGMMKFIIFPGPPGYEDVTKGDEPEPSYILTLDDPICIMGDDWADPDQSFTQVHLVGTNEAIWNQMQPLKDRKVTVQLTDQMGANTGHHHAPLVAWVTAISPAD